jgi:hypothetical protein
MNVEHKTSKPTCPVFNDHSRSPRCEWGRPKRARAYRQAKSPRIDPRAGGEDVDVRVNHSKVRELVLGNN